jgi:choice-of-anchor B domain-containing protein
MQQKLRFLAFVALLFGLSQTSFAQNSNMQLRSSITFPGQTLANICGWTSPDGKEYALVGASKGLVIVDITNPDAPVQIVQIPGPDNLWKEIKTYSHYAYVTSEGGGGVQIVDLNGLPSATLTYHNYIGSGEIDGQLGAIHALHIDVTKGYLYTYGGNFSHAMVHDLNVDPYNPTYVGKFDQLGYIHDGYVDNDTLYSCHIYTGLLAMVDMRIKSAPLLLGTVQTPGKFTHNAWIHSDRKHIFTTDETTPSFLTSYDISDPTDIKELDRFSIDNGNGSYGHNTHIINDYAVTSWYTGGVVITDMHRPANIVKVGHYDTWPGTGATFDGCWGAFPYFPSGNIVASNIENPAQMFVISPTYKRACYLEGIVRDGCNNQPLKGASVQIVGGEAPTELTNNQGLLKTGQVTPGNYSLLISEAGYGSQTIPITLTTAEVTTFDITLQPISSTTVTGTVTDAGTNLPITGIPVTLSSSNQTYNFTSNASGQFSGSCILSGTYTVSGGKWGYISSAQTVTINNNTDLNIKLSKGYYDDFNLDYGWSTEATSPTGIWERGEPVGTTNGNNVSNPDFDVTTDSGDQCYVTGNGGGQAGSDDVDNGYSRLISPAMDLSGAQDAILKFDYWFFNGGGNGGTPNDRFEVTVTNGSQTATVLTQTTPASQWRNSGNIHLKDYITLTNEVRVSFTAYDDDPGHLVEGGLDQFSVIPATVGTLELDNNALITAAPNPSKAGFVLQYNWPNQTTTMLEVRNIVGQVVDTRNIAGENGTINLGQNWTPGVYTATLLTGTQQSKVLRLVKQ